MILSRARLQNFQSRGSRENPASNLYPAYKQTDLSYTKRKLKIFAICIQYMSKRICHIQENMNILQKAQKLLDDLLDKNIEMVTTHIPDKDNHQSDGGLVKLFRKAPPGMRLDPIDQDPGPQKKPKIIPGEDIDEKSKKFRRNIQSVAVNGSDIVIAARLACQSSLARCEARDTAAKAAAMREEERVAELKRIRGEKWLPSVTREMKSVTD